MGPPPEPDASDLFFDALDAFPPPPGAGDTFPSAAATPSPEATTVNRPTPPPDLPPPSLRRRRSSSKHSVSFGITADPAEPSSKSPSSDKHGKRIPRALKDQATSDDSDSVSTLTSTSDQIKEQDASSRSAVETIEQTRTPPPPPPPRTQGLLFSFAGLLIDAIFFQINLLVKLLGFPIRLLYCSFLLVTDPLRVIKRVKECLVRRVVWMVNFLLERVRSLLGGQDGAGKLAAGLALGCFWSLYVCLLLLGLLVTAFLAGGMVMRRVVEKPVRVMADLNFDYTKARPEAIVPLVSCGGAGAGWECSGKGGFGKCDGWRPVPPNHKLQLTIWLTLPESDYNRNLGMFQVRAEFLSAYGKVTSSSSQPCILRFKSTQHHVMERFLKSGTLLAGYSSESQILRLKMTGFSEGTEPTMCIKVTLESRAEYRPGAGIPEIYAASLKLESELPLLKRIIWNWRKTVFIWISVSLFLWELFIVLICCSPAVIPRARQNVNPPNRA